MSPPPSSDWRRNFEQNASSGSYLKVACPSVTRSDASGNGHEGLVLRVGIAKISDTAADNNSGDGFFVSSGATYLNSAEANGNGAAGLSIASGAHAAIANCFLVGIGAVGVVRPRMEVPRRVRWSEPITSARPCAPAT